MVCSFGGHTHGATQPPPGRRARALRDDDAGRAGSAQTGGMRGKVTDAPEAGRRRPVLIEARASRGSSRSRRTRRASSSKSASTRAIQGLAEKEGKVAVPTTSASASATVRGRSAAERRRRRAAAQETEAHVRPASRVRRRCGREQGPELRRGDRVLPEGGHCGPELPRLLLQHRLCLLPEEGLRQRGSRVQEGHRAEAGLRRSLECARECLQHREEAR